MIVIRKKIIVVINYIYFTLNLNKKIRDTKMCSINSRVNKVIKILGVIVVQGEFYLFESSRISSFRGFELPRINCIFFFIIYMSNTK